MSRHLDEFMRITAPSYYICTGDEEEGVQEAIANGDTYYFKLFNIVADAVIKYENGHFYTDHPSMLIEPMNNTERKEIPDEESDIVVEIPGTGQGGTEQSGTYVGGLPDEAKEIAEQQGSVDTMTENDVDGTAHFYYKDTSGKWVEIPLLSEEEVQLYLNGLLLKSVNFEQSGTNVEVS